MSDPDNQLPREANDNGEHQPTEDKKNSNSTEDNGDCPTGGHIDSPTLKMPEIHSSQKKADKVDMSNMDVDELLRDSEEDGAKGEGSGSGAKKKGQSQLRDKKKAKKKRSSSSSSSSDSDTSSSSGSDTSSSSGSNSSSSIRLTKADIKKLRATLAKVSAKEKRKKNKQRKQKKSRSSSTTNSKEKDDNEMADAGGSGNTTPPASLDSIEHIRRVVEAEEEDEMEDGERATEGEPCKSGRSQPANDVEGGPPTSEIYMTVRDIRGSQYSLMNIYGGTVEISDGGSFRNSEDTRSNLTIETSSIANESTVSTSFRPHSLHCVCCVPNHPILGRGVKPVFVLADQMFPAAVPLREQGRCLTVLRLEDATLWELATAFLDKVKMSWLPAGTVVLISSGSHLARVGTAAYCAELTDTLSRLVKALPANSFVTHGAIIPLNGSVDQTFIRSAYDVFVWLLALSGGGCHQEILEDTITANMAMFTLLGEGSLQHCCSYRMLLPNCLARPEIKGVWASESSEPVPDHLRIPTEEEEKKLLLELIREVNRSSNTALSEAISTRREICLTHTELAADTIKMVIFIGHEAADMLYKACGQKGIPSACVKLADITPRAIERAKNRLNSLVSSQLEVSNRILLVYSVFDAETYVDSAGRQPTWASDNTYHIQGNIKLLGKRALAEVIEKYKPLLEAGGTSGRAILAPLPLFHVLPCCDNVEHSTNAGTGQYIADLRQGLRDMTRQIRDTLNNNGLRRMRVLNTARTAVGCPTEAAWGSNPWIMKEAAYSAILNAVLAEGPTIIAKRPGPILNRPERRTGHSSNTHRGTGVEDRNRPGPSREAGEEDEAGLSDRRAAGYM